MAGNLQVAGAVTVTTAAGDFELGGWNGRPAVFFPSLGVAWSVWSTLSRSGLRSKIGLCPLRAEITVLLYRRPLLRLRTGGGFSWKLTPVRFFKGGAD